MSSELLDQYIGLKNQMAALQRQIDKLKPEVANYVLDQGGRFSIRIFSYVPRSPGYGSSQRRSRCLRKW